MTVAVKNAGELIVRVADGSKAVISAATIRIPCCSAAGVDISAESISSAQIGIHRLQIVRIVDQHIGSKNAAGNIACIICRRGIFRRVIIDRRIA